MEPIITLLSENQDFILGLVSTGEGQGIEVVKQCKSSGLQELELQNEYRITQELRIKGIRKATRIGTWNNRPALFLEFIPGSNLKDYLSSRDLSIREALDIAITIMRVIHELHSARIIHKNLNHKNILIDESGEHIYLLDFAAASSHAQKIETPLPVRNAEGSFAFISPEQTGRINFAIDSRSDYYSFGVILYLIFSGRLPCPSNDPAEQVHFHLAQKPIPPHVINPQLPEIISGIILKLLAKNPHDRYQSSIGILHDLEYCRELLSEHGGVKSFPIAGKDFSAEFRVNDGIYGREKELRILLDEFEHTLTGHAGMVLLEGYSGIGKTSLVKEIVKPVFVNGGCFISGKFDQYQRDIPYSGITQALEKWVSFVLAEDEQGLRAWQTTLKECLGENGAVITGIAPGIERIIGPQAAMPELGSDHARIRFNDAVRNFFRAIAREGSPMVLFLDDMQWADYASVELLKVLFDKDAGIAYFMVITAYRGQELGADHPFAVATRKIEDERGKLPHITLEPLGMESVSRMLADILHLQESEVDEITSLVLKKTRGNPFYIRYFLEALRSENLLYYVTEKSRWSWDIGKIRHQSVTENVADLLTKSFARYSEETMRVLANASVIGEEFSFKLLSESLTIPFEKVLEHLQELLRDELILPADDWQKGYFSIAITLGQAQDFRFRFSHDRVRDHIYSGIPEEEKKAIHLKVGRILWHQVDQNDSNDVVFETIVHLNKAVELVTDPSERIGIARLNYHAGLRAKNGGAYQEAIEFFQTAIALLPADAWKQHYQLALDIYSETSATAYSGMDLDLLFHACDIVFENARHPYEKLTAVKSLILYYDGVVDDKKKVLSTLRAFLKQLNIKIPENPGNLTVLRKLLYVRIVLSRKTDEQILQMPSVSSPRIRAAIQLLSLGLPAAYRGYQTLYVIMAMEALMLDLKYGHQEESAFLYALFSVISLAAFNDIKTAKRFHKISLEILSRFGNNKELPAVYSAIYVGAGYLSESVEEILERYNRAFLAARENGNHLWAATILSLRSSRSFWAGINLNKLQREIEGEDQVFRNLDQKNFYTWEKMVQQAVACMQGNADDPSELNGAWYNDTLDVEGGHTSMYASYYAMKYYLASIFDQQEAAQKYARQMHKYLQDSNAEYTTMMFRLHESVFDAVNIAEGAARKKPRNSVSYFRKLTEACPDNFEGSVELIQGAFAWAEKRHNEAEKLFITAAQKTGRRGCEPLKALSYELAGRQAIQAGLPEKASHYLRLCVAAYTTWGAHGKVRRLYDKHAAILNKQWLPSEQSQTILGTLNTANLGENIDFLSILKASRAMLGEIALDKLLEQLMRIVLENGGATRGLIFLENNGKWSIEGEAEGETGVFNIQVLQGISMDSRKHFPESVINYVINTKEAIALENASGEGTFTNDPYVVANHLLSVLCLPLVNQGKLSAILYLENNLAAGAFSDQKNEVLKILSSEIAISIENARLYYNLNNVNKAYERFVPKEFLSFLNKAHITDLHLGDQVEKEMAVLFADIRNFTTISEQISAEDSFNLINAYLGRMEPAISRHHGFIDKYIGDEIMALFPTGVQDALNSALAMFKNLEIYNQEALQSKKLPIDIGIGINAGNLMLGIIGGEKRWDGTVISDSVNLASRLQQLTRDYSVPLLISEFAWSQLRDPGQYGIRKIDLAKIKGKAAAVTVYEVFEADEEAQRTLKQDTLQTFSEAFDLYHNKKAANALDVFRKIHKKNPADTVTSIYINRCLKELGK